MNLGLRVLPTVISKMWNDGCVALMHGMLNLKMSEFLFASMIALYWNSFNRGRDTDYCFRYQTWWSTNANPEDIGNYFLIAFHRNYLQPSNPSRWIFRYLAVYRVNTRFHHSPARGKFINMEIFFRRSGEN